MKRGNAFFIGLIICAVVLVSCNQPESEVGNVINVLSSMRHPEELKASEFIKKVRYVRLETTDECLIGNGALIQLMHDKILVTTRQKQCFLFDKATGRFICSVGHIGEDPGGYKSVNCWINNLTKTLYFEGWKDNWVCYDESGKFVQNIKYSLPKNNITSTYLDKDTYISQVSSIFSEKADSLYIFRGEEILESFSFHESENLSTDASAIEALNIIGVGSTLLNTFGITTAGGVMLIDFKEANKGCITIMNKPCLWHANEELYYMPSYNDTIYRIKDRQLYPAYSFNLGEYHIPYSERFNKKRDKSIMITQVMDHPAHLFFRFVLNPFGDGDSRKVYNAFYSKSNGTVKVNLLKEAITDDHSGFLPFQPQSISETGEYTGFFDAFDVFTWFEENPEKINALPEELKKLQSIKEEENPVVYIME